MKLLREIAILVLCSAILLLLPKLVTAYYLSLFFLVLLLICCGQSWNLIAGYTGYLSFGHAAFLGVGAYATAILITKLHVSWIIASLFGGVFATAIALTLGFPLVKYLRGPYFAISMLGLLAALRVLASYWESLTGGGYGLSISPNVDMKECFYVVGILTLINCYVVYKLIHSIYGYRLIAIREDELAANVMGTNTMNYKLLALTLSAFFPGVAGGCFAWYQSYLDPESAFSLSINVQMIAIVIFGGIGTISGPILGGFVLGLFSEIL